MNYGGIQLVKTTGKVLASDPQYLEIFMPSVNSKGKQIMAYTYARPCYAFGDVSAPSEAWLTKYKDEIQICVVYEEGNESIPMWIGYTPNDNFSDVPEDFPNGYIKKTEKFFIKIDDKADKLYIAYREATTLGQSIVIDKMSTTLGKESADKEPALLGTTTTELLGELIDVIRGLIWLHPNGPTTSLQPASILQLMNVKNKLNTLLSKSVKLD